MLNNRRYHLQELSSDSINKIVMGLQQASTTGMTQLPTSHIPMQTQPHMQDPQIQPNYVPTTREKLIILTNMILFSR